MQANRIDPWQQSDHRVKAVSAPYRLPSFVIVGAAKAGTTTLHASLSQVSGVFMSTPKEPEFFGREELFSRGLEWYAALFDGAGPSDICGEASTIYTRHPAHGGQAMERMAAAMPDAKLIYIVREPVRRTYSDYCQAISNEMRFGSFSRAELTFAEAVVQRPGVVAASRYGHQLTNMLSFYPREQILVLDFDDLVTHPDATLRRALDFLEVSGPPPSLRHDNSTTVQFEHIVRERMLDRLRKVPFLKAASRVVPRELRVSLYDKVAKSAPLRRFRGEHSPGEMDDATCIQLVQLLQRDVELFAKLSGMDVSRWLHTWSERGWA